MFQFDEQGRVIPQPGERDQVGNVVGLLRHRAKDEPVTVEEMDEAIRVRAAEKYGPRRR